MCSLIGYNEDDLITMVDSMASQLTYFYGLFKLIKAYDNKFGDTCLFDANWLCQGG